MSVPWILIPVHNRREQTLRCLRHLHQQGISTAFAIAVIDDGSTDGTAAAITREFPGVRILTGDGNLWWTGAIARGMAAADQANAPAVVWLNDDCLPDPGAIPHLVETAAAATPAVVGALCRDEGGQPVASAFVGRSALTAPPGDSRSCRVDGLSGFCVCVPRPVWTRLGLPDAARFPHYLGDTAYTVRARQAGFDVCLTRQATALLTPYRERPHSIAAFLARAQNSDRRWSDVFVSPRSPFRAAAHWHYLRLRYGRLSGSVLALARLGTWQLKFIAAARAGGRKSESVR